MGVTAKIRNGQGDANLLKIGREGEVHVVEHAHPPINENIFVQPYRMRFTDVNGSEDMTVDGSSTSVDFSIRAEQDYDVFVKTIFVEIADGGNPALNKFGALSALANGVEWIYSNNEFGDYTLHEGIKTNKEFIRIGIDTHGIGTGVDAYLADTSGGGTEKAYLPIIDMAEMYGIRFGFRLRKGTNDKITFRINDNLSGLSVFDAIAYGIRM